TGIDAEQLAQLTIPAQLVDVEEERPRRVRVIGRMTADELLDQPRVDRPERGTRGDATLAQQPLDLRAGEIGVDYEPGAVAEELLVTGLAQLVAAGRGAAVLPDE